MIKGVSSRIWGDRTGSVLEHIRDRRATRHKHNSYCPEQTINDLAEAVLRSCLNGAFGDP